MTSTLICRPDTGRRQSACIIRVWTTRAFTPAMQALRRDFAQGPWTGKSAVEDFDHLSTHVTVSVGRELAAMVRLTERPPSVLQEWGVPPHLLPQGNNTVEATRAIVAPHWRGRKFYTLLLAEATRLLAQQRVSRLVGAVECDLPQRPVLYRIGFEDFGEAGWFLNPGKGTVRGQIIVQNPQQALRAATTIRQELVRHWAEQGIHCFSTIAL